MGRQVTTRQVKILNAKLKKVKQASEFEVNAAMSILRVLGLASALRFVAAIRSPQCLLPIERKLSTKKAEGRAAA